MERTGRSRTGGAHDRRCRQGGTKRTGLPHHPDPYACRTGPCRRGAYCTHRAGEFQYWWSLESHLGRTARPAGFAMSAARVTHRGPDVLRVLFLSTSYPADATDWRGVFMRHLVAALARRDDLRLAVWA